MGILAISGALLIGLTLGLTGAGGSIITLPVLVYLGGIEPKAAVPMSLLIVGAAALTGALRRLPKREICLPTAAIFSATGMIGAFLGARLTPLVSAQFLMLGFAALMLAVAVLVLRPEKTIVPQTTGKASWLGKALAGISVGVLTGFIGVGGGFLLVPALLKFGDLKIRQAVGTSLGIISFNCVAGFLAHLGESKTDWPMAATYSVLACVGVLAGSLIAEKVATARLRQGFAVMVIITGAFVIWQNIG